MSDIPLRCVMSKNGHGCKLGAHAGNLHRDAEGNTWTTPESWGWEDEYDDTSLMSWLKNRGELLSEQGCD